MNRDTRSLTNRKYDLLIIGGGINGACAAWDASLRGLKVIMLEKEDFGWATSAATGKMIHGGIRYMQHAAFHRVYESLHERMVLLRIAPHLVRPIPFIIPAYRHGLRGKEILRAGMLLYDLLGIQKNKSRDPLRNIPMHRMLSKEETLNLEPGINPIELTGGVLFYDCQMHNPERLTLSFVQSAAKVGAQVLNYMQVTGFLRDESTIIGVEALDRLTMEKFQIRAKIVLNAAGPWISSLTSLANGKSPLPDIKHSKGIHLITPSLTQNHAIALATHHRAAQTVLNRGGRHFFIVPWRGFSVIGTTNNPFNGNPDEKLVTQNEILEFLSEVKSIYEPAQNLNLSDIRYAYGGIYPDDMSLELRDGYQGNRRDKIINHQIRDGMKGILSVIGVKFTTARRLAYKTVDLIFKELGYKKAPPCTTDRMPLYGGGIDNLKTFIDSKINKHSKTEKLGPKIIENLILQYGSAYTKVLTYRGNSQLNLNNQKLLEAQSLYAVREEMAMTLSDVVFRRTGIGTTGYPGRENLKSCAYVMAKELGWDKQRTDLELKEVETRFKF